MGRLPSLLACLLAAAGASACTAEHGAPGANGDFCAVLAPRVDAFLERASVDHPTPDDSRYGGRVVVAANAELAEGMNVATASDYGAVQHHQFVNLMTLLRYDDALEPVPYLAESWELAPDGSSVTFRLRQDVFWHDGEPTDAEDVAFTYRMVTDPAVEFPNSGFWDAYVRGDEGVEILDRFTVRILMRPHAEPLDPWRTVAMLPEHLLAGVEPAALRSHPYGSRCPVGNGPFVFREHVDQERWTFEANPAFPEALGGRPFLDAYVYRVIPDANTLLLELVAGSIDVYVAAQADQADVIAQTEALELRAFPFRNITFAAWNARRPPLDQAEVRRALALATDRESIVEALLDGRGTVAHGTVPPFHWGFAGEVGAIPYDPLAAASSLEAAGLQDRDGDGIRELPDGSPFRIGIMANQGNDRLTRIAEILQAQLGAVGVAVDVQVREWTSMIADVTDPERRAFDGVLLSWVTEFKVDDTDLFRSDRSVGPYGFAGIEDPELDALLDALRAAPTRGESRSLWERYQRKLAELQPFLFLYYPDRLAGVSRRVRNVRMDARGEWQNLAEWWVEGER